MVENFVRGKPTSASSSDFIRRKPKATPSDSLFREKAAPTQTKKRRRAASNGPAKAKKLKKHADPLRARKDTEHIDFLTFRQIAPGMQFLGVIRDIKRLDLVISLPNSLTGYASIREVSDTMASAVDAYLEAQEKNADSGEGLPELSTMFKIGDCVRCSVIGRSGKNSKKKHRIELSLRPSLINAQVQFADVAKSGAHVAGEIASIEDGGYVVKTGVKGVRSAFLKFSQCKRGKMVTGPLSKTEESATMEDDDDEDADSASSKDDLLTVGTPLWCSVKKVLGKSLILTSKAKKIRSKRQNDVVSIGSIVPGMLVECTVEKVLPTGLRVEFLSLFHGSVDEFHLGEAPKEGWQADYRVGQELVARVISVQHDTKMFGLTLRKHLVKSLEGLNFSHLDLDRPQADNAEDADTDADADSDSKKDEDAAAASLEPAAAARGLKLRPVAELIPFDKTRVFSKAVNGTVCWVNKFAGVLLRFTVDGAKEPTFGFAHISRLSDTRVSVKDIAKRFPVDSQHACRIVGADSFDGVLLVTLKQAVLDQVVMRMSDLSAGMTVKAKILGFEKYGLMTTLTPSLPPKAPQIRAVVSNMQMADTQVTKPHLRFDIGAMIECRVLSLSLEKHRVFLTHKRSLVESDLPLITDDSPDVGTITHGFVVHAKDYGVIVAFYGDVHGLIPVQDLQQAGFTEHPSQVFHQGQVLKVRVAGVTPAKAKGKDDKGERKNQIKLSLNLEPAQESKKEDEVAVEMLPVGTLIKSATVESVADFGITLKAKVHLPTSSKKAKKTEVSVLLPTAHLTDHPALADALRARASVGDKLANLLVLGGHTVRRMQVVTRKPSLLAAHGTDALPEKFEQLKQDALLRGFVRRVADFGVFVSFLGDLVALAYKSELADTFVKAPKEHFEVGQSVCARVVELDHKESKVVVSLKPSRCNRAATAQLEYDTLFLDTLLKERNVIASHAKLDSAEVAPPAWLPSFPVGGLISDATVLDKRDFGLILDVSPSDSEEQVTGFVIHPHQIDSDAEFRRISEDDVLSKCCVLDIDQSKRIVDLSLKKSLLSSAPKSASASLKALAKAGLKVGDEVPVEIQLVKDDYFVVSVDLAAAKTKKKAKKDGEDGKNAKKGKTLIGYASAKSYNMKLSPHAVFQAGYRCKAFVAKLQESPTDRVFFVVDLYAKQKRHKEKGAKRSANRSGGEDGDRRSAKRARFEYFDDRFRSKADFKKGKNVKVRLGKWHKSMLTVSFAEKWNYLYGKIHREKLGLEKGAKDPWTRYSKGDLVEAAIISVTHEEKKGDDDKLGDITYVELSLIPRDLEKNRTRAAKAAKAAASKAADGDNSDSEESDSDDEEQKEHTELSLSTDQGVAAFASGSAAELALANGVRWSTLGAGQHVRGTVERIASNGLWVTVKTSEGERIRGFVHALEVSRSLPVLNAFATIASLHTHETGAGSPRLVVDSASVDRAQSLCPVDVGTEVVCRVVRCDEERKRLDLSLALGDEKKSQKARESVIARVVRIVPNVALVCEIGHHKFGRVHICDLSTKYSIQPLAPFSVGMFLRVVDHGIDETQRGDKSKKAAAEEAADDSDADENLDVIINRKDGEHVLSVYEDGDSSSAAEKKPKSISDFREGDIVRGYVKASSNSKGVFVWLTRSVVAYVIKRELSDGFVKDIEATFRPGKRVKGRVIKIDEASGHIQITLKTSRLQQKKGVPGSIQFSDLSVGQVVSGVVKSVLAFGVFVQIEGSSLTGLCHMSEVSGGYIKDPASNLPKLFAQGDEVLVRIIKLDAQKNRISFTMREDRKFTPPPPQPTKASKDSEKDADMSDEEESDGKSAALVPAEDDKSEVLLPKRRVAVGGESDSEDDGEDDDEDAAASKKDEDAADGTDGEDDMEDSDDEDDDEEDEVPELDLSLGAATKSQKGSSAKMEDESDSETDSDDEVGAGGSTAKLPTHGSLKSLMTASGDAKSPGESKRITPKVNPVDPSLPVTSQGFEKLLAGSPASSRYWIAYMDFLLRGSQVELARKTAERALSTIPFRDIAEKFNVWVAFLNLENSYGTKESLKEVLNRALQRNDQRKVYLRMAKIYITTRKLREANECYQRLMKKYGHDAQCWQIYAEFLYANPKFNETDQTLASVGSSSSKSPEALWGKKSKKVAPEDSEAVASHLERARGLLARAMQTLEKKQHVPLISRFAQLEFRHGAADRGRTLFEGILSSYPKKIDVWNVYIDYEVRQCKQTGNLEYARHLFERAIVLPVSWKKVQRFFERFLLFENEFGTPQTVAEIRQKAEDYVAALSAARGNTEDDDEDGEEVDGGEEEVEEDGESDGSEDDEDMEDDASSGDDTE